MLPSLGSPSTTSTSTFGSLRRGNAAITSSPVSTSQSIKTRVTNLNQIEVAELKTASNLSAETPRMINMDIASNSGSLKRATGSGDVLADSRQEVQNYISTTKDIPKLREKSPADCGSLKRYVASGVLAESNQKSNRPESDIPRMLDVMANESGNLKRSVGSGDVLLDYLQQQVVDSTVQGIPKVRHNSDVDNGSLKRATASGDMCSSAKEALDYMRAEVPKVIDGSIQNLRRVAASNAGLLHSREFSVKSAVETLKGSENLESADLRRMTSSSRCAATNAVSDSSDSRVTLDSQASSKQFREVNRRGLESPTRSKRASREINSFQADANDSRPQSHTWNSADKKPDLSSTVRHPSPPEPKKFQ
ncbi:hypothetical protein BC830DRAFT_94060 [Chytriomyces sp. MP71]|nr:hypothetical protein BC830DRAFT_94060 [Chytriomyces sp. MP71]